jgi:NAD(P)H-dependent flavin oxidoreductase YrpB (nitropropane dioxygenase family)
MSRAFEFIALSLPVSSSAAIAIAASRAGAIGVLDLEHAADVDAAAVAMASLARHGRGARGIKLDGRRPAFVQAILARRPRELTTLILTGGSPGDTHTVCGRRAGAGLRLLIEITSVDELDSVASLQADGLVAKGHEAGGWVGDETAFILLQHLRQRTDAPVWIHGGVGLLTAAGCRAAGAAGVVLDSQLALTRESELGADVKAAIGRMDGSETACLSLDAGRFRVFSRPGVRGIRSALQAADVAQSGAEQREAVRCRIGWGSPDAYVWPLGQEAAFARRLADRYHTVGGVIGAFRQAVEEHVATAAAIKPLQPGGPLAGAHGTRYPIVQGPRSSRGR